MAHVSDYCGIVYGIKLAQQRWQVPWRQRLKDWPHNETVSIYVCIWMYLHVFFLFAEKLSSANYWTWFFFYVNYKLALKSYFCPCKDTDEACKMLLMYRLHFQNHYATGWLYFTLRHRSWWINSSLTISVCGSEHKGLLKHLTLAFHGAFMGRQGTTIAQPLRSRWSSDIQSNLRERKYWKMLMSQISNRKWKSNNNKARCCR